MLPDPVLRRGLVQNLKLPEFHGRAGLQSPRRHPDRTRRKRRRNDKDALRSAQTQKGVSSYKKAKELVEIDENEEDEIYGQRVSEVFHRGDVFINSKDEITTNQMTQRFINAFFGRTNIAPTRDEMGSYFAEAASLRSVDLSRQVGAAVFSKNGDILAVGCNEVPKPGGGNYWDEDEEKSRDIDRGGEANKEETERIIFDFLRVLSDYELFKEDREPSEILKNAKLKAAISDSLIGGHHRIWKDGTCRDECDLRCSSMWKKFKRFQSICDDLSLSQLC